MKFKGIRFLIYLAVFASLFCSSQIFSNASESVQSDFIFENSTGTITGYKGQGGEVTIPEKINGITVVRVGKNVFSKNKLITKVTLPKSIKSIGSYAFFECINLKDINLPSGLTNIEEMAFCSCSNLASSIIIPSGVTQINNWVFAKCFKITKITLPAGIEKIGDSAFNNTGISSIIIPNKVFKIDYCAFTGTKLTSITIPSSVKIIEECAFSECKNLTTINVSASNTNYSSKDGVLFNKSGDRLFRCSVSKTTYTIPSSVKTIDSFAFEGSSLTSITIPKTVTSLGRSAFMNCTKLTQINIKANTSTINDSMFSGCTSITSLTLPDGVTTIGNSVFKNCKNLKEIYIPSSVNSIVDNELFITCKNVTIYGKSGSYAQTYAKEHNIPFVVK